MFDNRTRALYRRVKKGDEFAMTEWRKEQYDKIRWSEQEVEWLSFVLNWRNLTIREANRLYDHAKNLSMICPLENATSYCENTGKEVSNESIRGISGYTNAKRDAVRQFTWHINRCPSCNQSTSLNNAIWYKKRYIVHVGMIKLCRNCVKIYDKMLSIYWSKYVECVNTYDMDVASTVYSDMLRLGLIYDPNCEESVCEAYEKQERIISNLANPGKKHNESGSPTTLIIPKGNSITSVV